MQTEASGSGAKTELVKTPPQPAHTTSEQKKKRVRELFWQCWDLLNVSERTDAKTWRHILEPRLARIWIGWF
jgi:hypothetical protein